jgi:hypothetical protein
MLDQEIALTRLVRKQRAHFFERANVDLAAFGFRAGALALGLGSRVRPGDYCCHSKEMEGMSKMYNALKDMRR